MTNVKLKYLKAIFKCTLQIFNDDADLSKYVGNAEKLALLLDYDGTLAPPAKHPDLAILPNETRRILERLSNCPDVYVSIISNRTVENVMKMVIIMN